ncbi:hypothetical protein [Vibrio owensii]|uniref:hypothetical protein n=1 Tax=Vibrio owensii TaxID=696485 RepID=UPI0018F1E964|nr:hypothetical protein [Vibrio owensii]
MLRNKGFTATEAAIALAFAALYLVVTLVVLTGMFGAKVDKSQLKQFLDKGFLAAKVQYQDHLVNNGYCFTTDPPDYTVADFKANFAFWKDDDATWINPQDAVFKIDPNPDTGRVDKFRIVIKRDLSVDVPDEVYLVYPYYVGSEVVSGKMHYYYETLFQLNDGWRVMYSTTSTSCVQPY